VARVAFASLIGIGELQREQPTNERAITATHGLRKRPIGGRYGLFA
jgi:hypothetical protein